MSGFESALRRVGLLLSVTLALLCASVLPAAATQGWVSPVGACRYLLGYGDRYESASGGRTHSGVDLPCEEGAAVSAVSAGTVTFAGWVPSGDSRVLAVSLSLEDGHAVSLMPLSRITVAKGEAVAQGARVGEVAEAGDPSSAETHLHVGVTRNGAKVDPATMLPGLAAPCAESKPITEPQPEPKTAPAAPVALPVPAVQPAPVAASPRPAPVAKPSEAPVSAGVGAPSGRMSPSDSAMAPLRASAPPIPSTPAAAVAAVLASPTTRTSASPDALLSLPARLALAEERVTPASRLPDLTALARVRALGLRLALGALGAVGAALYTRRLARDLPAVPRVALATVRERR